jgi:integrase
MHLYLWGEIENINIEQRILQFDHFNIHEIDSLVRACRFEFNDLLKQSNATQETNFIPRKIVSMEKCRASSPMRSNEVSGATSAVRIQVISKYVKWLIFIAHNTNSPTIGGFEASEHASNFWENALSARMPKARSRSREESREGLSSETIELLLRILNPDSIENPWASFDRSVAKRNQLIIVMLYTLGIRRGELLGIKIEDIDFQKNQILIPRRPDDPEDPRADQPNAKTRDRLLPLDRPVADMIYEYIVWNRSRVPNAKKHPFLLVTHKNGNYLGSPLSIAGYSKMIESLRQRVPDLPDNLTGHLMRHSWNDSFSRMIDQKRNDGEDIKEPMEEKMRSFLMGWREGSGTAAKYNKRHIRKKSNRASLDTQRNIVKGFGINE